MVVPSLGTQQFPDISFVNDMDTGNSLSIEEALSADKCELMTLILASQSFNWNIGNINIDGIPRKIPVERVYRGTSMHGEILYS